MATARMSPASSPATGDSRAPISASRPGELSTSRSATTRAPRCLDVVSGLQWVLNNKARYNIRVVNLSLNSAAAQAYHVDPIDAACRDPLVQRHRRRGRRRATTRGAPSRPPAQRSLRHHRGRHRRPGHGQPEPTTRWRLLGERAPAPTARQARPRGAGHEYRQPDGEARATLPTRTRRPRRGQPTVLPHVGHVDGGPHGRGRRRAAAQASPA